MEKNIQTWNDFALYLPLPQDKNRSTKFYAFLQWIYNYSKKSHPLSATTTTTFSITKEAETAFYAPKEDVENLFIQVIEESLFEVETDASEAAIALIFSQAGHPIAFFLKHFTGEAQAIIEAVYHWRHYLTRRHFTVETDQ